MLPMFFFSENVYLLITLLIALLQLSINVASPFHLMPLVSAEEFLVFEEIQDGMFVQVYVLGESVFD